MAGLHFMVEPQVELGIGEHGAGGEQQELSPECFGIDARRPADPDAEAAR